MYSSRQVGYKNKPASLWDGCEVWKMQTETSKYTRLPKGLRKQYHREAQLEKLLFEWYSFWRILYTNSKL